MLISVEGMWRLFKKPSQIRGVLPNGEILRIELADHPFVQEWSQTFLRAKVVDPHPQLNHNYVDDPLDPGVLQQYQTVFEAGIANINRDIDLLETRFDLRFPLRASHSMGRHGANRIHRCFTTGVWTQNRLTYQGEPEFEISEKDRDEYSEIFHRINTQVHLVEQIYNIEKLQMLWEQGIKGHYTIEFDVLGRLDKFQAQPVTEKHHSFFTGGYTVYSAVDILGKSYMQAFIDDDDPTEWDVTHPLFYTGSLMIDFDDAQTRFAQDQMFQNWLRSYGIEPQPIHWGYLPVGFIRQPQSIKDMPYGRLKSIELV